MLLLSKNKFFIGQERENFFGRKKRDCLLVPILEKRKEIYIGIFATTKYDHWKPTYNCQKKRNKLVDSLKRNLKKI